MIRLYNAIPFFSVARTLGDLVHPLPIAGKLIVTPKAAVLTAAQHKRGEESRGGPEFGEHGLHSLVGSAGSGMRSADPGGAPAGAP